MGCIAVTPPPDLVKEGDWYFAVRMRPGMTETQGLGLSSLASFASRLL